MIIGQYKSKVSLKGRVSFPKKFREEMGEKLVVTLGYEGSLIVVSAEGWRAYLKEQKINLLFLVLPEIQVDSCLEELRK